MFNTFLVIFFKYSERSSCFIGSNMLLGPLFFILLKLKLSKPMKKFVLYFTLVFIIFWRTFVHIIFFLNHQRYGLL